MKTYAMFFLVSALGFLIGLMLARFLDRVSRKDKPSCHYCGTHVANTKDHVIPKRLGGTETVPSCANCNLAKGSQVPSCSCAECQGIIRRWITKAQSLSEENAVWTDRLNEFWNESMREKV